MKENKTIRYSVSSADHKEYLNNIAIDKGFKNINDMSRYALAKLLSSMKVPFKPDKVDHRA